VKEKKEIKNVAASVKERLRNISVQYGKEFQSIVSQYVQERFLYRLSQSNYSNNLILKGALLFIAHDISRNPPTRDIDFLGISLSSQIEECIEIIKDIASIKVDDGVEFTTINIKSKKIKEDSDIEGVRVHIPYKMDTIKGYFSIDIGFEDTITNEPYEIEFPVLLDFPSPKILVYSLESVVEEKFEAIVNLNFVTSRMKDFDDFVFITKMNPFNKTILNDAISRTFENRETNIKDSDIIFNENFRKDIQKQKQWQAFLQVNKLDEKISFPEVLIKIQSFIQPIFEYRTKNNWNPDKWKWE
jgi:predicted nucleotidyltransferase component of viral defense system